MFQCFFKFSQYQNSLAQECKLALATGFRIRFHNRSRKQMDRHNRYRMLMSGLDLCFFFDFNST